MRVNDVHRVYIREMNTYGLVLYWLETREYITWINALQKQVLHVYTVDTWSILCCNNMTV